ncbi:acyl-CoA dehydrogenase family protein [Pseudonocardia cypriaca]|uniref:Alkylation response protein AidB-like acyl-CoA dehydrogenase n=1 Tax=Pseudonocardia cypriaca TaxID=882449 RepID=A0A543FUF8_9PSEU|nr:acyl-CoA dehydrogenase family protein [Pseudonocardia cypriaca]TQM37460.1 alkylation response protein AidB-like acyl-CoA dehydrogenase [Pseudonocardia cypriaca]
MTLTHDRAIEAARGVAAVLAKDALERDRANAEPLAEAQLLRDAGLPALLLPTSVGGDGLGWATALRVVREIAVADGSIAQLLGYHYVNVANLWWVGGLERWGPPSAAGQWLWGDAVNPTDPDLELVPDGSGYRLNGRKSFATGVSVGDASVVSGTAEGEPLLVVVRGDAPGLVRGGDWDNLGQRLSASGSVRFTDVAIGPDQVLGGLGEDAATPRSSLVTPAIQAVFGAFYLGVAQGALGTARDYTRTTSRPWILSDSPSAAADPYVLATYGRLVAATRAVEALADAVAGHLDRADAAGDALTWEARGELAEQVAALKVVSTDVALDVTNTIFEVTGARATSNAVGLDRFWRNVRTHTLHDPVAYKRREVGDHFLNGTHPPFTLYT